MNKASKSSKCLLSIIFAVQKKLNQEFQKNKIKKFKKHLTQQLKSLPLTELEKEIFNKLFGLRGERKNCIEELMPIYNLDQGQILRIKSKVLRSIRHPQKSRKLKDYLNEDEIDNRQKEIDLLYKNLDEKIIPEKRYTEKEINEILKLCNKAQDHVSFRRELLDKKYLFRNDDCREYWRE